MHHKLSVVLAASVCISSLAGCGVKGLTTSAKSLTASAAQAQSLKIGMPIPGKAIVKLKPGRGPALKLGATLGGAKVSAPLPNMNLYGVSLAKGQTVADLKKQLGDKAQYVEADVQLGMADPAEVLAGTQGDTDGPPVVPVPGFDDPLNQNQWGVAQTHQAEAIKASNGGSASVTIAIVDTGIDLHHPDLESKILKGYNATGPDGLFGWGDPADDNGHGTHCAGIAAAIANNGVGVMGMAPNCKILPVKVLAGPGSGSLMSVATGINWAADHGADVISMSLGGSGTMQSLGDAVAYALSKNVVVVAAMGNSGHEQNPVSYPASYPGVIGVAASDWNDHHAFFSSFNTYTSVTSPGCKIFATTPTYPVWLTKNYPGHITNNYSYMSGTSMATPLVAGLCGLIRSVHPGMSPKDVKHLLEVSADKVPDMGGVDWDQKFGWGRINALKAVTM